MMSLRTLVRLKPSARQLRHLASLPDNKIQKNRDDLYQFNKQSLIVYGPLLNAKPRKRNYKPVYYKEPQTQQDFGFIEVKTELESDLLPVLNLQYRGKTEILDLNELLARPLIPGEGVDPALCRIEGRRCLKTLALDRLPSVTAVLEKTMPPKSREMLEKWKKEQIELLGEAGFNEMQKETLSSGHQFHSAIYDFLSGVEEEALEMTSKVRDGLWVSVRSVLENVSDVHSLEEAIVNDGLLYSGIVDCVAEYKDTICVIDWKTSKKAKKSLRQSYDNPVQVAAYVGALNSSGDKEIRNGILVYAYPDGAPADAIAISPRKMHHYWQQWLQRLQTYWKMAAGMES